MTNKKTNCSECGTAENVKPAREYTELAQLLEAWQSLEASGDVLLCPNCAEAVCKDLRGEGVQVLPLDLNDEDTSKR